MRRERSGSHRISHATLQSQTPRTVGRVITSVAGHPPSSTLQRAFCTCSSDARSSPFRFVNNSVLFCRDAPACAPHLSPSRVSTPAVFADVLRVPVVFVCIVCSLAHFGWQRRDHTCTPAKPSVGAASFPRVHDAEEWLGVDDGPSRHPEEDWYTS
jgi:hypothetical protein